MSAPPVILAKQLTGKTEIARSFSYKLNVGNFESRDFFCSQKAECPIEDAERVSELLYEFCKRAVIKSVGAYMKDIKAQKAKEEAEQEKRRYA